MVPIKRGNIRLSSLSPLATGGMGELRKGFQPDGTALVLRELHRRHIFKPPVHLSFLRGTKLRETLTPHPNIVFSVDRGYNGLRPYEIIEYVDGRTIRQLMERSRDFLRENTLEILRQAATALAHMHHNHILHLDIKAENYLVRRTEDSVEVKLTDFDLACNCDQHRNRRRAGTLRYMAPEELRAGEIDIGTDVFAFGVFAYYLVTARMPFEGETVAEARQKQMSDSFRITPPSQRVSGLPPELDRMILACLERQSAKRLPSMTYIVRELAKLV